jgi:hypothetical protein
MLAPLPVSNRIGGSFEPWSRAVESVEAIILPRHRRRPPASLLKRQLRNATQIGGVDYGIVAKAL